MEELTALKTALSAKDQIIADLQAKVKKLEKRADELDQYTDDLEQYSRRNSLRIQGLPEAPGEDEDPMEKTLEFANCTLKLNPPLLASDIDRAHRTGKPRKPGQPRAFLIKFATYQQRRRVLMSKQLVRKTSIYINEDLTPNRAALRKEVRTAKNEEKISECWTADGRIFARKTKFSEKKLIKRQEDLDILLETAQE